MMASNVLVNNGVHWPRLFRQVRPARTLVTRRQATETQVENAPPLVDILQQCIAAHWLTEELGSVPQVVAESWGRTCEARLRELHHPLSLPFRDSSSGQLEICQLTLVGIFHRDAANLRIVRDAIGAATPDAVALEARPSFLPSYVQLAESLPDELVGKLFDLPLHDLQEALDYVHLEDRLAWHEVLLVVNEGLLHSTTTTTSAAAPPHLQPPSPSSALTPTKVVSSFLARELALSDKVAAVLAAAERGLPLYGIELDEPAPYLGLSQGPLTAGDRQPTIGPSYTDADSRRVDDGSGRGGVLGGPGGNAAAVANGALSMGKLEAVQLHMALASLEPHVAAAFQEWFRNVPPGDFSLVLQQQLAGLMPQCMSPESYMSYMDETDALWSDERRVGRAAAAQHGQLTAMREEHFLDQLRRVAAGGGTGGKPCTRLLAVMGRGHAARLRRALLQQERQQQQPPPPPP